MSSDDLGNRMKWFEERYTNFFMPMAPVVGRLDGRAFHNFTKDLTRPFDAGLSKLMIETTKYLVGETNARCGYTQSDEITLVWLAEEWKDDIFFSGKIQKMNSILASMATAIFNKNLGQYLPQKIHELPLFDCRVFQVPVEIEAVNCFLWREQDATRNSIQMAARAYFDHGECHNKSCDELQEMLWSKRNINWNDYPAMQKRGTYVRRKTIEKKFTAEDIEKLPLKHAARTNPDLTIVRSMILEENLPILSKIENREDVILRGANPIVNGGE